MQWPFHTVRLNHERSIITNQMILTALYPYRVVRAPCHRYITLAGTL